MDFASVSRALDGAYGAWVNTDGFTVGEMKETYAGIRIFELAKKISSLRHLVWSNLDYASKVRARHNYCHYKELTNVKKGGFDPKYKTDHYDGKGHVAEFLRGQPSYSDENGLTWSIVTSGPYMEMLNLVN